MHDAWSTFPPSTQGLYGLKKLVGEMIILQYRDTMDIKIAWFHIVFKSPVKSGYCIPNMVTETLTS